MDYVVAVQYHCLKLRILYISDIHLHLIFYRAGRIVKKL